MIFPALMMRYIGLYFTVSNYDINTKEKELPDKFRNIPRNVTA